MDTTTTEKAETPELVDSHKPLWRTTLKAMRDDSLGFGTFYSNEWLEGRLAVPFGTVQFVGGICNINKELKREGYLLRSRGHGGQGYSVVRAENAEDVARTWASIARARILDTIVYVGGVLHNPQAMLDEQQRLRLAKQQEKAAMRYSMILRTKTVHDYVTKNAPKLLKEPSEPEV